MPAPIVRIVILLTLVALTTTARADDLATAKALLKRSDDTLAALNSASAKVTFTSPNGANPPSGTAVVECAKPNLLRFEAWPKTGSGKERQDVNTPHEIAICDGKMQYYGSSESPKSITATPVLPNTVNVGSIEGFMWGTFYGDQSQSFLSQIGPAMQNAHITTGTWDGDVDTVIDVDLNLPGAEKPGTMKVYIAPDKLIHRVAFSISSQHFEIALTDVRLNPTLPTADFEFHKPAYATVAASKIDPTALALLAEVDATTAATQALTATVDATLSAVNEKGKPTGSVSSETNIKLMRPNYAFADTFSVGDDSAKPPKVEVSVLASDGTSMWMIAEPSSKTFTKKPVDTQQIAYDALALGPYIDFFTPHWTHLAQTTDSATISLADKGAETWNGTVYHVVELHEDNPTEHLQFVYTLYIGDDKRIHRMITSISGNESNIRTDFTVSELNADPKLAASDFAYTPPKGFTLAKASSDDEEQPPSEPLLANGTKAPNFTVHDRHGKPIRLSDFKGRVVVLDFWATWCGPCQMSMPSTNAVARKFKNKHVVVLGVNVWDTKDAFQSWLPEHKSYDAMRFAIDPTPDGKDIASTLYHVSGIPTQYVIDRHGRIVWSTDGFSGSDDELVAAVEKALARR